MDPEMTNTKVAGISAGEEVYASFTSFDDPVIQRIADEEGGIFNVEFGV